jgi:hypothetical protein
LVFQSVGLLAHSIAFDNGQFVALGDFGKILTSVDGMTWKRSQSEAPDVRGVAYASGQWVAVGQGGTIQSSNDGTNWVLRQGGTLSQIFGIAYINGQFVAVGDYGNVLTSLDGASWTSRYTGTQEALQAMAFGNGRFVTVGTDCPGCSDASSVVLTSTDAVHWEQRSLGTSELLDVAYGNGQFLAVGDGGRVLNSVDGVNWTAQDTGTSSLFHKIAYGAGQFVVLGFFGAIVTSTDGVNWVARQSDSTDRQNRSSYQGIAYGNGQFVVVGGKRTIVDLDVVTSTESIILTSGDGVNWIQRQSPTTNVLSAVAFGGGQFAALSGRGVVSASDGVNWTLHPSGLYGSAIAYGSGHFVVAGSNATILQSGSIINLSITRPASAGLLTLSLEGPAGLDYTIQTSSDLITWRDVTKISNAQSSKVILDGLPAASDRQFYRAISQ